MKWPEIPKGADKPPWGGLLWALPMAYIFWDPYQRNAAWTEWLLTALAFALFLLTYTAGLIWWSRKQIVRRVCLVFTGLAVIFTAYRPSGIIFFTLVAAFGPFAAEGHIRRSLAIVVGACAIMVLEWRLFWPPHAFPYVIALQALFVGGGTTFVARQQQDIARAHKATERERIARDLHDILGHTLSVVILKSELAGKLIRADPQRAKAEIEDVERTARNALAEVREAIAGYRSGDLPAEFARAKAILGTAGVSVEGSFEQIELPAAHERVLALVLREAVTNIVRHARAKHCRVAFEKAAGFYRLEIGDDGCGEIGAEGMGMQGIRERVTAIGGSVSWSSQGGAHLSISVPAVSDARLAR